MAAALSLPDGGHARVGWVLCRPFGAEAIRASLFFRALSAHLCAQGCAVLRFDYHGTGDSPGEGAGEDFARWQQDILEADAALRHLTGVPRTHWFGLGLGATLAARAAEQSLAHSHHPEHLVLWEPVQDGAAYGRDLCEHHRGEMRRWLRSRWDVLRRDYGMHEPTLPGTVLGFEVGAALARDLASLRVLPLEALLRARIGITLGVGPGVPHPEGRAGLQVVRTDGSVDWMSNHGAEGEVQYGAAMVPAGALQAVRDSLQVSRPELL